MTDPLIPLIVGAAKPLAAYLGAQLEDDEREAIERAFAKAVAAECGLAEAERNPRPTNKVSRARRWLGEKITARPTELGEREAKRSKKERKQRDRSAVVVAQVLGAGWQAASPPGPASDGQPPRQWEPALRNYVEVVACKAIEGVDDTKCLAWSHAVTGEYEIARPDGTKGRTTANLEEACADWAARIVARVKLRWFFDNRFAVMLRQMNFEDGYALAEKLVGANREIANRLWRLVTVGIPLLLLGGGAVALLVLFVDKG
jgi:hypothetical protein